MGEERTKDSSVNEAYPLEEKGEVAPELLTPLRRSDFSPSKSKLGKKRS